MSGVGPFPSGLVDVGADPAGLRLTISITNDGSSAAAATCRHRRSGAAGIGPETAFVQSPVVQPGATATFETVVTTLGTVPRPLTVACGR